MHHLPKNIESTQTWLEDQMPQQINRDTITLKLGREREGGEGGGGFLEMIPRRSTIMIRKAKKYYNITQQSCRHSYTLPIPGQSRYGSSGIFQPAHATTDHG